MKVLRAVCLFAAPFMLALGLVLPLIELNTLHFFSETPSLVGLLLELWGNGDALLAVIVALFSVVFPVVKLIVLTAEFVNGKPKQAKGLLVAIFPYLAKWSMMDVMLVAIVIFAAKTSGFATAFTQPGLWFYAGSAILSGILPQIAPKPGD